MTTEGTMEATEIAEKIHGEEHEAHTAAEDASFRKYTGIYLGIVAMLLAITALGGAHATKTIVNSNIQASDTYAFYQARNIRQTAYQIAAEELDLQLLALEGIDKSGHQRAFWSHDRQIDGILLHELQKSLNVLRPDIDILSCGGCARVAGGDKDPADARTLGDLPRQRVFSPAAADHQDFHCGNCSMPSRIHPLKYRGARPAGKP